MDTSENWVEKWFIECERLKIKPWEWDFKQCYMKDEISVEMSRIALMLTYKNENLTEIGAFNTTKKAGKSADCDKEPKHIYSMLWPLDQYGVIRGESMNSFVTTFNESIKQSTNKKEVYSRIHLDDNKGLSHQYGILQSNDNFIKFELIQKNLQEFETFARRTHTIGNFTVLPHWWNTGRYNFSQDYWDITLQSLFDMLHPFGAWKPFVECFYLQPYVNNDQEWSVDEFWSGHFTKIGTSFNNLRPQNHDELKQFLQKVNLRIEERGKMIIKVLCEKLMEKGKKIDFEFYNTIKNNEITFSDLNDV